MKYLWQKLQDDSEKEQSIMCSTYKRALRSITISFLKVQFARKKKVLTLTNTRWNISPNMQVESSASPLLTIDEVEKIQRQRIPSFIGHVFQLTYTALVDKLIQQE